MSQAINTARIAETLSFSPPLHVGAGQKGEGWTIAAHPVRPKFHCQQLPRLLEQRLQFRLLAGAFACRAVQYPVRVVLHPLDCFVRRHAVTSASMAASIASRTEFAQR